MTTNNNDSTEGMQINPQRAAQLLENLHAVRQRVQAASAGKGGGKPVGLPFLCI